MTSFSPEITCTEFNVIIREERHLRLAAICGYLAEKLPGAEVDARHDLNCSASIGVFPVVPKYWDKVINEGLKHFAQEFNCKITTTRQNHEDGNTAVIQVVWKAPCSFNVLPWPLTVNKMTSREEKISIQSSLKSTPFILSSGEQDETR